MVGGLSVFNLGTFFYGVCYRYHYLKWKEDNSSKLLNEALIIYS